MISYRAEQNAPTVTRTNLVHSSRIRILRFFFQNSKKRVFYTFFQINDMSKNIENIIN